MPGDTRKALSRDCYIELDRESLKSTYSEFDSRVLPGGYMQTSIESFPFYPQFCFCVLGILISIILPVLRRLLPKPLSLAADIPVWKRYAMIGLFSLTTAV